MCLCMCVYECLDAFWVLFEEYNKKSSEEKLIKDTLVTNCIFKCPSPKQPISISIVVRKTGL